MSNKKLEKWSLESVLLDLSPETRADDDMRADEEIIQDVVKRDHPLSIQKAIEQGREVLAMKPFPWEWVQSITQSLVYDEKTSKWVEDPILYQTWLKKVINTLEEEAKRQGKL